MKPPHKTIEQQIDEAIENDIDFWVESKERDPEQLELIEEEENGN